MQALFTIASFVAAQQQTLSAPPTSCQVACNPVLDSIAKCKDTTVPQSKQDWVNTLGKLAQCVCPVMLGSQAQTTCASCLSLSDSASPGTAAFQEMIRECQAGIPRAAVLLGKDFGQTVEVSAFQTATSTTGSPGANVSGKPNSAAQVGVSAAFAVVALLL